MKNHVLKKCHAKQKKRWPEPKVAVALPQLKEVADEVLQGVPVRVPLGPSRHHRKYLVQVWSLVSCRVINDQW